MDSDISQAYPLGHAVLHSLRHNTSKNRRLTFCAESRPAQKYLTKCHFLCKAADNHAAFPSGNQTPLPLFDSAPLPEEQNEIDAILIPFQSLRALENMKMVTM